MDNVNMDIAHPNEQDCTNMSDFELMMVANLFAAMSCADGVVHDVENFTAKAFLEEYSSTYLDCIKDEYHFAINISNEKERNENIQGLVCCLTEKQKIKIFKSLCAIAASDGVIHPREETLIDSFLDAINLGQSSIQFANERERYKQVKLF